MAPKPRLSSTLFYIIMEIYNIYFLLYVFLCYVWREGDLISSPLAIKIKAITVLSQP
jgi:hypothetical protein